MVNFKKSLKAFILFTIVTVCYFLFLMPQALTEYSLLCQLLFTYAALSINYSISTTSKRLYLLNCFVLFISACIPFILIYLSNSALSPVRIYREFLLPLQLLAFLESVYTMLLLEKKNSVLLALLATMSLGIITTFNIVFSLYYPITGAVFNDFAILAIWQTNFQEALEYIKTFISYPLLALAVVLLLTHLILLYECFHSIAVKYQQKDKKRMTLLLAFCLLSELALLFTKTPPTFMMLTLKKADKTIVAYKQYYANFHDKRTSIQENLVATCQTVKPNTYILIIGESETRDHMGAYGYQRTTTPWLSKEIQNNPDFILFTKAYSSDHATISVLSSALTESNNYNNLPIQKAVSIIDVAKKAGFETIWLSNQMCYGSFDSPTTAIAENADKKIWLNHNIGTSTQAEHYDDDLLPQLKKLGSSQNRRLIIIHLMGCHASYMDRYPPQYDIFTNTENIKEINTIKDIKRYNQYDNAVYYNDHILKELFSIGQKELKAAAVLYMSDHGEELRIGYGHNLLSNKFDYTILRIPFFISYNPKLLNSTGIITNLKAHRQQPFTNDVLYDTLVGLMNIKTPHYNAKYDLSSTKFDLPVSTLCSTEKKRKIGDDPIFKK
jgi:heptose-I-phosphate ethanolaminephosphotransferase